MTEKDIFAKLIKFIMVLISIIVLMSLSIGGLFGYYIHKTFEGEVSTVITTTQEQDGENNIQENNTNG